MSELLANARRKKDALKHLLLELHRGEAAETVRRRLEQLMGEVPYDWVVEVEQELLAEGLPASEILKFCDIHTNVLKGKIKQEETKPDPPGHPLHTFREENRALQWEINTARRVGEELSRESLSAEELDDWHKRILYRFQILCDVEKHYQRKENLLFPFLEQHGITGPSTVMWAKDDEARQHLNSSLEALQSVDRLTASDGQGLVDLVLFPALEALEDMIYREENVLFPMARDTLSAEEWRSIYEQTGEIGYCLIDAEEWQQDPSSSESGGKKEAESRAVTLPSGSLRPPELEAILNTIPFDLTFVDAEDRVKYFTQGKERIFTRTRAILGRKVQLCHPPDSVHIVEKILEDFKSGHRSHAPFWINLKGRFIHIEYFALRDKEGNYLGTLEVSQDLTVKRSLEGEQRLLSYEEETGDAASGE